MHYTQKRYGSVLKVIMCGGPLAPISPAGYSGCQGTGNYDKGRKCFRCAGWGYQTKKQYDKNLAYDTERR
jgi:hypothetical protein